jgi:hypothetical protein
LFYFQQIQGLSLANLIYNNSIFIQMKPLIEVLFNVVLCRVLTVDLGIEFFQYLYLFSANKSTVEFSPDWTFRIYSCTAHTPLIQILQSMKCNLPISIDTNSAGADWGPELGTAQPKLSWILFSSSLNVKLQKFNN